MQKASSKTHLREKKPRGEEYVSGMVAAIANAVYNATGVRVKSLPVLPERILMGLREKEDP